jgi:hypothetical protein
MTRKMHTQPCLEMIGTGVLLVFRYSGLAEEDKKPGDRRRLTGTRARAKILNVRDIKVVVFIEEGGIFY